MIGKPKDVKVGNWVRVGDDPRWRAVKKIKRGRSQTTFALAGKIPKWVVPTDDPIWYESHPGYAVPR